MNDTTTYAAPEMSAPAILKLFETTKEQRESFVMDLVTRIDNGDVDPLEAHLQIKCVEDIIKLANSNTNYKSAVLEAAERYGAKSFQFHNAKVEIKEAGVSYDFTKCEDPEWEQMDAELKNLKDRLKARETFLKTVSPKGLTVVDEATGNVSTIYPPAKASTTTVAISLK